MLDAEDAKRELLINGMFRNRDPPELAKPISGSNADWTYDTEEIAEICKMTGLIPVPVYTT